MSINWIISNPSWFWFWRWFQQTSPPSSLIVLLWKIQVLVYLFSLYFLWFWWTYQLVVYPWAICHSLPLSLFVFVLVPLTSLCIIFYFRDPTFQPRDIQFNMMFLWIIFLFLIFFLRSRWRVSLWLSFDF